jgi:hypothetical protein
LCEKRIRTNINVAILSKAHVPFVLVACKCDQHPAHREVDPVVVEQKAKSYLGEVPVFQSSSASAETQRECITFVTKAVIAAKRRKLFYLSQPPTRALSYSMRLHGRLSRHN